MSGSNRYANGSARRKVRAWLKAQGLPCHLCGRAIDYSLPSGHPMSFEVDHKDPCARGGALYDRGNLQPAHRICNERKSDKQLYYASGRVYRKKVPREWDRANQPDVEGHGADAGVPSASTGDIEAAIADAYGPRCQDLPSRVTRPW